MLPLTRNLKLGVLSRAIDDLNVTKRGSFQSYRCIACGQEQGITDLHKLPTYAECAQEWIDADDDDDQNELTFNNICYEFELNPAAVRRAIRAGTVNTWELWRLVKAA